VQRDSFRRSSCCWKRRADPAQLGGADALFTPYFHPAGARELAPAGSQVAIVRQFSPAAVRSALLDDPQAVARLVEAADLVLATNAARLPEELLRRVRRLLRIGWTMEGGLARAGGAVPA
jgi:hypothetical protein